jgi:hypothetical protein
MENINQQNLCRCFNCKEIKPRGQLDYCKDCTNAWARKKYKENKQKKLEANQRWINNNPGYFQEMKQKINCECGCLISKGSKSSHLKSKKHSELIMKNNNNPLDV